MIEALELMENEKQEPMSLVNIYDRILPGEEITNRDPEYIKERSVKNLLDYPVTSQNLDTLRETFRGTVQGDSIERLCPPKVAAPIQDPSLQRQQPQGEKQDGEYKALLLPEGKGYEAVFAKTGPKGISILEERIKIEPNITSYQRAIFQDILGTQQRILSRRTKYLAKNVIL